MMPFRSFLSRLVLHHLFFLVLVLSACTSGGDETKASEKKASERFTLVTATEVKQMPIEITEHAVGSLEGVIDPTVAAEIAGRVIQVHFNPGMQVKQGQLLVELDAQDFSAQRAEAQAEVAKVQAQIENQTKVVERNRALVDKHFISQNALDADISQKRVLEHELEAAKARADNIQRSRGKTKIFAPVTGKIETRLVGPGDYVKVGDPITQIVSSQRLRAHLPFPEQLAAKLKPGLTVRLRSPVSEVPVITEVHALKPMLTAETRSIDLIADVLDAPGWQAGASVEGDVILGETGASLVVPETSVVLRPAGEVVYVVQGSKAIQKVVQTGYRKQGWVEIKQGLSEGDTIVVDGAGFLSDGANIKLSTSEK